MPTESITLPDSSQDANHGKFETGRATKKGYSFSTSRRDQFIEL